MVPENTIEGLHSNPFHGYLPEDSEPMADQDPQNGNPPKPPGRRMGKGRGKAILKEQRKPPETPRAARDFDPDDDPDDDLDLDDFGIDPLYGKMTLGMRLVYFLMIVGFVAMVGYLILIILFPDQFGLRDWIGSAAPETESERVWLKGFQLGGVYLGVTPDEVRRDYPSLRLEPNPNAGPDDKIYQFGRFLHHGGEYQISFLGPKRGNRVFEVHSLHTYQKVSYLELLTELSGRYGKPGQSECQASETDIGIQCVLYWRTKDTLLNAQINTIAPKGGGEAKTTLEVTAKDIRPDHFFARVKTKKAFPDFSPYKK